MRRRWLLAALALVIVAAPIALFLVAGFYRPKLGLTESVADFVWTYRAHRDRQEWVPIPRTRAEFEDCYRRAGRAHHPDTRSAARGRIGRMGEFAAPFLIEKAKGIERIAPRDYTAYWTFLRIGQLRAEAATEMLLDKLDRFRRRSDRGPVIDALIEIGDTRAREAALALYRSPTPHEHPKHQAAERRDARRLVGRLGGSGTDLLAEELSQAEGKELVEIMHAISLARTRACARVLMQYLHAEDPAVRAVARGNLSYVGDPALPEVVAELERTRNPFTKVALVEIIVRIGTPRAARFLLSLMDDPLLCDLAIQGLGRSGDTRALRELERRLYRTRGPRAVALVVALGQVLRKDGDRAARSMISCLEHPSPGVRRTAIDELAEHRRLEARPALQRALADPVPWVARGAGHAVERLRLYNLHQKIADFLPSILGARSVGFFKSLREGWFSRLAWALLLVVSAVLGAGLLLGLVRALDAYELRLAIHALLASGFAGSVLFPSNDYTRVLATAVCLLLFFGGVMQPAPGAPRAVAARLGWFGGVARWLLVPAVMLFATPTVVAALAQADYHFSMFAGFMITTGVCLTLLADHLLFARPLLVRRAWAKRACTGLLSLSVIAFLGRAVFDLAGVVASAEGAGSAFRHWTVLVLLAGIAVTEVVRVFHRVRTATPARRLVPRGLRVEDDGEVWTARLPGERPLVTLVPAVIGAGLLVGAAFQVLTEKEGLLPVVIVLAILATLVLLPAMRVLLSRRVVQWCEGRVRHGESLFGAEFGPVPWTDRLSVKAVVDLDHAQSKWLSEVLA